MSPGVFVTLASEHSRLDRESRGTAVSCTWERGTSGEMCRLCEWGNPLGWLSVVLGNEEPLARYAVSVNRPLAET